MTDEKIAEILEYEAKATPGPWEFRNGTLRGGESIDILCAEIGHAESDEDPEYGEIFFGHGDFGESQVSANWIFCQRARTDLPKAMREIQRLKALLSAARENWI